LFERLCGEENKKGEMKRDLYNAKGRSVPLPAWEGNYAPITPLGKGEGIYFERKHMVSTQKHAAVAVSDRKKGKKKCIPDFREGVEFISHQKKLCLAVRG